MEPFQPVSEAKNPYEFILEESLEANKNNELDQACDQIQIEKSSMDENEIERNLENYDYRHYKGIDKEREKVVYYNNAKKIEAILGV